MEEKEIIIGNLTTIIMFVFSTFGGGAIIDWLGGSSQAVIIIGAVLGLGFSYINAYFPNYLKFLNNHDKIIGDVADCISNTEHECCCSENDDDIIN